VYLPHAPRRSREIDSISPAGRFDSTRIAVPDHRAQSPDLPHFYKCLPIPRDAGLPSPFAGFFALVGRPSTVGRPSRPAPARDEPRPLPLLYVRNRLRWIRRARLRFDAREVRWWVQTACCSAHSNDRRVNWNYSKIPNGNNGLQKNFDHKRVLFVQHPSEKGQGLDVRSGSFVACAEVLGNCDRATEGGIPRSSRFRWFA
jgi:hypothetical protein